MNRFTRIIESTKWDAIIPLCAFGMYFWLSLNLYPRMAPDEYMRLLVPFFITENNALPLGPEPEIINPIWGFSYAYTAYGPSMLSALFMQTTSLVTTNPIALIVAARFTSVLSGALTVFLAMRIARRLFKNSASPLMLGILVAFTPQFAFMSAYHNNDIPSTCTVALIILAWIRGIQDGWNTKNAVLLGFGLGACSVTYYFGYGFVLASIPLFFVSAYHAPEHLKISGRKMWRLVGIVFIVALVTGGWYFIRNGIIFDGDIIGMSTRDALAERMAQEEYKPSTHMTPQRAGWSLWQMFFDEWNGMIWWQFFAKSIVGFFGYMELQMSLTMYLAYSLLIPLVIVGLFSFSRVKLTHGKSLLYVAMLVGLVTALSFTVYYSWASDYEPQGRYIYSAFVVLALYAVLGLETLLTGVVSCVLRAKHILLSRTIDNSSAPKKRSNPVSIMLLAAAFLYIAAFVHVWKWWLSPILSGIVPPDSLAPFIQ